MSQIIIIYEKKILKNFPPTQNGFFALRANLWLDFSEIQQGPQKFDRENSDKKISCRAPKVDRKLDFFTDKSRILLITLLQNVRNKKANILR